MSSSFFRLDAGQVPTCLPARKSYKKLRSKPGEAVWPPSLETALLEALRAYRPGRSDQAQLKRFPKRNRFVSDYILRTTGSYRSPKQVGSRVQQIARSTKEKRDREARDGTEPDTDKDSTTDQDITPRASPSPVIPQQTFVTIDIMLESASSECSRDRNDIRMSITPPSGHSLQSLKPVVSFFVRHQDEKTIASRWTVFFATQCVHEEWTALSVVSGDLYKTSLIPGYWAVLCSNRALPNAIIRQDIVVKETGKVVAEVVYGFHVQDGFYAAEDARAVEAAAAGVMQAIPAYNKSFFDVAEVPHWQQQYGAWQEPSEFSFPCDVDLPSESSCFGEADSCFPETDFCFPETDSSLLDTNSSFPETSSRFLETNSFFSEVDCFSETTSGFQELNRPPPITDSLLFSPADPSIIFPNRFSSSLTDALMNPQPYPS